MQQVHNYNRGDKIEWPKNDTWHPGVVLYSDRCELIIHPEAEIPSIRTSSTPSAFMIRKKFVRRRET